MEDIWTMEGELGHWEIINHEMACNGLWQQKFSQALKKETVLHVMVK